jgi:hypothetical protein
MVIPEMIQMSFKFDIKVKLEYPTIKLQKKKKKLSQAVGLKLCARVEIHQL